MCEAPIDISCKKEETESRDGDEPTREQVSRSGVPSPNPGFFSS